MASSSSADRAARRRHLLIGAAAAAAVLVASVVAVLALRPHADDARAPRFRAADKGFSVVVPDGWRALRGRELAAVPSAPAGVLRRADGRAVVIVRERAPLARSTRSLTSDLTAQLGRRFRGLKPVTARTIALPGGPAYVYTFARPSAGRVQSIAVAPRGNRTWTLDAVAGAGAPDAAAEVGAILRSFDTTTAPRS